ncbi:MAG: hypothetical protein H5T61_01745 [Thermoflexales bacterium]|nr:hypothetical protein [Thermoflexales bacterium]
MKGKWTLLGSIVAVPVLALAVGLSQAQGPEPPTGGGQPQGEVSGPALMGTAFTYQGYLKKGGTPYSGTCEFQFSLWDAAGTGSPPTGGNQIGTPQTKTGVQVTNGLFTIPDLDFGAGAFNGDARWLQITIKCAGDSGYVLSPRQPLTPAPYALALPGLRTQQNDVSPNIIGGYSGNYVQWGVVGATISGGGRLIFSSYPNRITDSLGTIGGGEDNQAGNDNDMTDDAMYATVGGGAENIASGQSATVGGGMSNTASGLYATVGGGYNNTANGDTGATVSGGIGNAASGLHTTVGGGIYNMPADVGATVGGGLNNTASGDFATVPGGYGATASHYGEMAYASGTFGATAGNAQTSLYVMRIERACTAGNWYDLYLNGNEGGSLGYLTIAPGRAVAFDALVVGRTEAGESAGYLIRGLIENVGGTTAFVGSPSVTLLGEDDAAWNAQAVASNSYDALFIQVQGNGETIRWVATVRTVEVSW